MFVTIGRTQKKHDLVDALLECHERIRRFTELARELGARSDLPTSEVRDTCERCARYFTDALPLHVADEEQSLVPRLAGLSREVDEALATMETQHREHQEGLSRTLRALEGLRAAPSDPERRAELHTAASALSAEFTLHLAMEETVLFPAIRTRLPIATQELIAGEVRARRDAMP